MPQAIRVHQPGGAEVLKWEEIPTPAPGPGEALIRHHAVGLNYIDIYYRSGVYPHAFPMTPGSEGAGIVEAIGTDVSEVKVGDRVAYAGGPNGAYATLRCMPARFLVRLPEFLSFEQGAAMMLQGMTVRYLVRRSYPVKAGDWVLFHAAAGGVGLLACQWLHALGVTVIGTVSSEEKAALARAHGCTHTINYTHEDFSARVRELTNGKGVPVVYDSIGKDTWEKSLDCLQPLGYMISFGNASGVVPPVALTTLSAKGSIYVQRPTLGTHTARRDWLEESASDLFNMVQGGRIQIRVNQRFPLKDAAEAHRALEGRKTTGSTVLLP